MAHFAHVIDGVVQKVHVVANDVITDSDGVEQESLGQEFLATLHGYEPSNLIQCSYNATIRGNYPASGFLYDVEADIFIRPKPFASWVLDEDYQWQSPIPMPLDGNNYEWDEQAGDWVEV